MKGIPLRDIVLEDEAEAELRAAAATEGSMVFPEEECPSSLPPTSLGTSLAALAAASAATAGGT